MPGRGWLKRDDKKAADAAAAEVAARKCADAIAAADGKLHRAAGSFAATAYLTAVARRKAMEIKLRADGVIADRKLALACDKEVV